MGGLCRKSKLFKYSKESDEQHSHLVSRSSSSSKRLLSSTFLSSWDQREAYSQQVRLAPLCLCLSLPLSPSPRFVSLPCVNSTRRESHIFEQSAFTFLIAEFFGSGKASSRVTTLNDYVSIPRYHATSHHLRATAGGVDRAGAGGPISRIIHRNQTQVKELSQLSQCNVSSRKVILCSTCFV
jgi:hypothetical protein